MSLAIGNTFVPATTTNTSIVLTLSYSAGSIIIIDTQMNGGPGISVVSAALGAFTFRATANGAGSSFPIERWFFKNTSPQTSDTITITQTGNQLISAIAYEIQGANTTAPFDSGGPQTSGSDPVSITTANANTMVIAGFREGSTPSPTPGAGFTNIISGGTINFQLSEYQILSSAQTLSCTQTTGAGNSNGCIADAIVQASGSVPNAYGLATTGLMVLPCRRKEPAVKRSRIIGWRRSRCLIVPDRRLIAA